MQLDELLTLAAEQRASDVFLKEGARPAMRIHGKVIQMDLPVLDHEQLIAYADSITNERQQARFEECHELDLAFEVEGVTRIRANIFQQRGGCGMVLRLVPLKIPTLEELSLPPVLKNLCQHRQGLILVTGPTGSGKSSTLAAMIDLINSTKKVHIITVEDPIEYTHPDKMGVVDQREVGVDTDDFGAALKYMMRQSPDVIMVGELRDMETLSVALQASETGHLVFSTLHTSSAPETLDRIVNMFQPHEKPMICERLSNSLRGVISQKLVPRKDGNGRVAAVEVMVVTPTIAKMIGEGRFGNCYAAIGEGEHWGMQTMNQCLLRFYTGGVVTAEEALYAAGNQTELRQMMRQAMEAARPTTQRG
ncbi:MAG TPA: type IV pilus twitching motility protein PilT [Armatimonadota bacterium]|nr:type IV pilus twitching motility protein PilT [Armatimonadota bacterium]